MSENAPDTGTQNATQGTANEFAEQITTIIKEHNND